MTNVKYDKIMGRIREQDQGVPGPQGPQGPAGQNGRNGQDAYNPFKGWYESEEDLRENNLNPRVGDYAYVMIEKGELPDGVYVYDCNVAGTWSNSGVVFNPDNVGDAILYSAQNNLTNSQRTQALANVENQTAGYDASDPPVFTGKMGYKVLQPGASFASQVTEPNTIYEIRDVFDGIGTQETPFSFPQGITLKFNGGKISNSYISGDGIIIEHDGKNFDNCSMTITNYKKSVSPRMFGNDTAAIQKAIDSFPQSSICLDGVWNFNGTITVPYDVSLYCENGEIVNTNDVTNTSVFEIYCGKYSHDLVNLTINTDHFITSKIIVLKGTSNSYNTIRGFGQLESNIGNAIYKMPYITGSFNKYSNNNVGVFISYGLFYLKTIECYSYRIYNCLRIVNNSDGTALTGALIKVNTWHTIKGVVVEKDGGYYGATFDIIYQALAASHAYYANSKCFEIENYDVTTTSNFQSKFYVHIADPQSGHYYIDNPPCASFFNKYGSLTNLSKWFTQKTKHVGNIGNILGKEAYKEGFSPVLSAIDIVDGIIGNNTTRTGTLIALRDYFLQQNIDSYFIIRLYVGGFRYINSSIISKLERIYKNDNETTPILLSNSSIIEAQFIPNAENDNNVMVFRRVYIKVTDLVNKITLHKVTLISKPSQTNSATDEMVWYEAPKITSRTTEEIVGLGNLNGYITFNSSINKLIFNNGTKWLTYDGQDMPTT